MKKLFHDSFCPKESFSATACSCGFVQEFLEPDVVKERLKNAVVYKPAYNALVNAEQTVLFNLEDLLLSLKERSKSLPPFKD